MRQASATRSVGAPLVSLVVMSYNQAEFIAETVAGALAQDYPNLEIVFSDDGSGDDTFALIERAVAGYAGKHAIRLNRNTPNMGFIGHLNHIFSLCRGELIVYNAGDDISLPTRVSRLMTVAQENPELLLIHSDAFEIDAAGARTGAINSRRDALDAMPLSRAATAMGLCTGATCAWRPEVMTRFGPIVEEPTFDDLIFCFRALMTGGVVHVPEPLIEYRVGVGLSNMESLRDLPLDAMEARTQRLLKKLDLRSATLRQRLRDCRTIGAAELESVVAQELATVDYGIRLLREPGFDRWSRLRSLGALRESLRVRTRLRKKLSARN
ncbi:glycosyltransferase [Salipiger mangrovisoli]|uniref:Glycosyltransferase n=1 Tax=Salipiger mangrovisoli TaxID=2865933 RepID=A0ABR9XBA7_9RHOB|nr:glycosyltransferase [Salipiger mangrovisoli]MBE9640911.1 glycosyltransferase [Salipiger mangrovisoli]